MRNRNIAEYQKPCENDTVSYKEKIRERKKKTVHILCIKFITFVTKAADHLIDPNILGKLS